MSKVLTVGSIAYDVIFSVHNKFKEEIIVKENKVEDVSMMLTANDKKMFYGGTAGNIAYGLALQGVKPFVFSVVGDDYDSDYGPHLKGSGVIDKIVRKEGEYTATFYGISDVSKEQIGIFQPNTHGKYLHELSLQETITKDELENVSVAIFSPGTGESTMKHMKELREINKECTIIFDPSQVLSIFFTKEMLLEGIEIADIFIGNETELAQLQSVLNMDIKEILAHNIETIIETKGSKGSVIHSEKEGILVPAVKVDNFKEQTGAGDAFRAGFINGLLQQKNLEESCKIGSKIAALNVASEGSQNYTI